MRSDSTGGLKSDLNVTPLVDVVLVLLIIFMVVTPMLKNSAVDLPKARSTQHVRQDPAPVTVTVAAQGVLTLGSEPLPKDQLPAVFGRMLAGNPNVAIQVKGDRHLKFKDVKQVLDALHAAGATRLSLAAAELKEPLPAPPPGQE